MLHNSSPHLKLGPCHDSRIRKSRAVPWVQVRPDIKYPFRLHSMAKHTTRILVFLILSTAPSYVGAEVVFRSNYDVILTVEGNRYHSQSRAQVRDGHTIPIVFHDYRIELAIFLASDEKFSVVVTVFENLRGSWYQMDIDSLSFEGGFGIPVEYRWNRARIELDIAIVVSVVRR